MRSPNSWYTACESLELDCRPLSEIMVREHPHKGMYLLTRILALTLSGKLGGIDGEQIVPSTETIIDQQDVGVALRCDRKRAEVADTDGNARTFREKHGDDWPTDRQPRGFPRLALQALAKLPPGANRHADPPVKPLQHAQCARGPKVARIRRLASLHDPNAHE